MIISKKSLMLGFFVEHSEENHRLERAIKIMRNQISRNELRVVPTDYEQDGRKKTPSIAETQGGATIAGYVGVPFISTRHLTKYRAGSAMVKGFL